MTWTGEMDRMAAAVASAVVLLSASCTSEEPCASAAPVTVPAASSCPDLRYAGNVYTEWREADPPRILQEVGDATYPACNDTDPCDGRNFEGFGATDVWLVPGVDPSLLDPRGTWADPAAYDRKARELARMFRDNFARFADVAAGVAGAGPRV